MAVNQGPGSSNGPMSDALKKAAQENGQHFAQQSEPAGQTQQNQGYGHQERSSILNVNTALARPMSRNSTAETVQGIRDAIQTVIDKNLSEEARDQYRLLVLDNNQAPIAFSSLLLTYRANVKGKETVAVYTLMLECSGAKLGNQYVNIGGQNVEIEIVTGDVYYQEYYWNQICSYLTKVAGRELSIHDGGVMVIPTEFDPKNEDKVRSIVFNATNATYTIMDNLLGGSEVPFSVAQIDKEDQLYAGLDFGSETVENAVGQPIRADIKISLRGATAQGKNVLGYQQVREISSVCGYMDLVFEKPQMPQQMWNQPQPTQSYYPRFVMTRVDTEIDAVTLELQLFNLSTATILSKNMAWAGAFKTRYVEGEDLRDIGAIGYEVNPTNDPNATPQKINTKSDSFSHQDLGALLSAFINDALIYSMDIEEVGELSWIHQTFIAAANGSSDAYNALIQAANNLTNGAFATRFPQGEAICVDDDNRIHLGWYTDINGEKRDLRDIDYLAMLNLVGGSDRAMVEAWEATFLPHEDLAIRLEKRAKILKALLTGKMEIKGFARRITFNPNFLRALSDACIDAGLHIRPKDYQETFGPQYQRGHSDMGRFAVQSSQVGGLFTYGQQGGGGSTFFNTPFTGRYGAGR